MCAEAQSPIGPVASTGLIWCDEWDETKKIKGYTQKYEIYAIN